MLLQVGAAVRDEAIYCRSCAFLPLYTVANAKSVSLVYMLRCGCSRIGFIRETGGCCCVPRETGNCFLVRERDRWLLLS
jgi:hypothetical protein